MENDLDYNRIGREKTQPDGEPDPPTLNGLRGVQREGRGCFMDSDELERGTGGLGWLEID